MNISTNSKLFKTFDGTKLFEVSYSPEKDIKGVIVIIHGLTEHSGFYSKVSRNFSENQYAVNLFDLRGHGKSDGAMAFVDSFDDYLNDLSVFLDIVKNRYPKTPIFLLGQGMGGVLTALYVIENRTEIRGLIMSAPAFDITKFMPPCLQTVAWVIGKLAPRCHFIRINPSALTKDSTVTQDYEKDPLIYHGKVCARTCLEIIRASKNVIKRSDELKIPVLIIHGEEDQLCKFEGSREFHEKVGHTDNTFKLYKGLSHSLLLETEGKKVIQDIIQWADSHVRTT
ncbi:MAG: alpha/beta hydrolase [Acidobacteriota bacterium]